MSYSLDNNGQFYTTSNLERNYKLEEIIKLPIPNGVEYSENQNRVRQTLQGQQVDKNGNVVPFNHNLRFVSTIDVEFLLKGNLDPFVSILNGNQNQLVFEQGIPSWKVRKFIKDLNKHSSTNLDSYGKDEGLKNRIVDGAIKITMDPRNQLSLQSPVKMDEQQLAAANSPLGNSEKTRTMDVSSTKFMLQYENMQGKGVVGIVAVGMKNFFMLSNFYNNLISDLVSSLENEDHSSAFELIKQITFNDPLNANKIASLANLNYNALKEVADQVGRIRIPQESKLPHRFNKYYENNSLNIQQIVKDLIDQSSRNIASGSISGLLNAATDNAKELILAKINATSDFVTIYTYLLSIGTPFKTISDIMTSKLFTAVGKLTKMNIFDKNTYHFSVSNAINFYLGEELLNIMDNNVFGVILDEFDKNELKTESDLSNSDHMIKFRNFLRTQIGTTTPSSAQQMDEFQDQYNEFDDYEQQDSEQQDFDDSEVPLTKTNDDPSRRNLATNPINKADYRQALILVNHIISRNNTLKTISKTDVDQLYYIAQSVLPALDEFGLIGSITASNQGIKTNSYEKYAHIKRIENGIDRVISKENKRRSQSGKPSLKYFNLMDFLSDEKLRNDYISQYEDIKTFVNPLRAVDRVPHFREMFKIHYYDNALINTVSMKNRLEAKFAKEVLKESSITQLDKNEYKELGKYVDDVIIFNWIRGLDLKYTVPVGQSYFIDTQGKSNTVVGKEYEISLNTIEGLATFKKLVDNVIIPALKNNKNLKDNMFLKNITTGIFENPSGINEFWRPIIEMMQIDKSVRNQTVYTDMLRDFDKLSNIKINGMNVINTFFLYNLLVNKDAFGRNSFVRFFENAVRSTNDNLLVKKFYKWMSDNDYNQDENMLYDLDDLKYRLTTVSSNPYTKFDSWVSELGNVTISKGSKPPRLQAPKNHNISYYTLNMPFVSGSSTSSVVADVTPIESKDDRYFKFPLNDRNVIFDIIENFEEKYGKKVHATNNEALRDSPDEVRNARAFIENGEVYINMDKASFADPLHELTHVILAGLKFKDPDVYYNLLSAIQKHPEYENKLNAISRIYTNKHLSDLREEVFVTIMSDYFANKLYKWDNNQLFRDSDASIKKALEDMFQIESVANLKLQKLMTTDVETILYNFGSMMAHSGFDSYINIKHVNLNQELAALKDQLIKEEELKCND